MLKHRLELIESFDFVLQTGPLGKVTLGKRNMAGDEIGFHEAKTLARELCKDRICLIENLKNDILRNTADLDDYQNYFSYLEDAGIVKKEEVQKMFVDNGFDGLEDYVSKREHYLKSFSFSNINWDDHSKFEGDLQDRIICLSYKTIHLPNQVAKVMLGF